MASVNSKIHTLEENHNTVSKKLKDLEAQIRTLLIEQNKIKCDSNADEGKCPQDCKTIFTYSFFSRCQYKQKQCLDCFIHIAITTSDKCDDVCDVEDVLKKTDNKCQKQDLVSQVSIDRHSNKGSVRLHLFKRLFFIYLIYFCSVNSHIMSQIYLLGACSCGKCGYEDPECEDIIKILCKEKGVRDINYKTNKCFNCPAIRRLCGISCDYCG